MIYTFTAFAVAFASLPVVRRILRAAVFYLVTIGPVQPEYYEPPTAISRETK